MNNNDEIAQSESLIASFHRVESLIPIEQELEAIPPEMRVSDALKLMQQEHYSQLPVVAGDAVLGVFSYRSFSTRALAKQKSAKDHLGNLPVEEFLDDFEYVHPSEDWNRVVKYLDLDDAFFVGHRDGLEGMVTTIDMLAYFRTIANPFILIAEIEQSLRDIIRNSLNGTELVDAIDHALTGAYKDGNLPKKLNEMTFADFVSLITSNKIWPSFQEMFGRRPETRKRTQDRLDQVREWRNIVFHFKRRLEPWELEILIETREWLHNRVRAFDGRRRHVKTPVLPESVIDHPTEEDFERLLTRRHLPEGQRLLYKALYHSGSDEGLTRNELVDAIGGLGPHSLAGILGALGTRVNYTRGYGKTFKPGVSMVLTFQKTMDGEKIDLVEEFREVLEKLEPDWLQQE